MLWVELVICLWIAFIPYTLEFFQDPIDSLDSNIGVPTLLLDSLQLTLSSKLLLDINSPRGPTLKGYLGLLPSNSNIKYKSCSGDDSTTGSICLNYGKNMKLLIMQDTEEHCEANNFACPSVSCYKIHWENHIGGAMDCFLLGDDFWYGGGEVISERWPIQGYPRPWHPAATGDPLHHSSGNIVENLWLSSSGFSIYVDRTVPLFVSFNESSNGKLCFTTSTKKHPFQNTIRKTQSELTYSVCTGMSVKDVYVYHTSKHITKPKKIPDKTIFQHPIWSTWAKYKQNINEEKVLEYAREIKLHDFPASQLEIDDNWENCHGDLSFNEINFPNPQKMITILKEIGLPTTLWIHPFCNKECDIFSLGERKNYWIKDTNGNTAEVKWWNGVGALLDFTNPEASKWFVQRLEHLQALYGVQSFKFDAGEVLWLEQNFTFYDESANFQPSIYSKRYAEIAAKFGGKIEVRVGFDTQHLPIFVRMFDKFSKWDYSNGLQNLIPTALHMSIMGYPFILPDMIGGNNYDSIDDTLPNRELYIRWLQASLFMPAIQFSIAPWDYDEEVVKIAKSMLNLREKYLDYILNVASQCTVTGYPIIRPLWWLAADEPETLNIDSQFLVGDGLMVAPVLEAKKYRRTIYLPRGSWHDVQRGKSFEGSQWLYDYNAPLDFLPYFVKQN